MIKQIIKCFLSGLMIFKILTVGLSVTTAYEGVCLHIFNLINTAARKNKISFPSESGIILNSQGKSLFFSISFENSLK